MFKTLLLSAILITSNAYGVQVFNTTPTESSASMMGRGLAIMMREQEIRNQKAIAQKNYIYKLTLLRDYSPEKHQDFVDSINRSNLEYGEKLEMIFIFETAHKNYINK